MGFFSALIDASTFVVAAALGGIGSVQPAAPATGVWPIQPPAIVHGFDPPSSAWSSGHRGVDLAAPVGTPVLASTDGTVTFAGAIDGRGVVVISHGDTRTTYEPLLVDVSVSDVVHAGDEIGRLDLTQSHCLPLACLHWGWIRGTEYLNPLELVGATGRVRLLPLTPGDAPDDRPS